MAGCRPRPRCRPRSPCHAPALPAALCRHPPWPCRRPCVLGVDDPDHGGTIRRNRLNVNLIVDPLGGPGALLGLSFRSRIRTEGRKNVRGGGGGGRRAGRGAAEGGGAAGGRDRAGPAPHACPTCGSGRPCGAMLQLCYNGPPAPPGGQGGAVSGRNGAAGAEQGEHESRGSRQRAGPEFGEGGARREPQCVDPWSSSRRSLP